MASLHPTLDEIAGHGIAFIDLCAEMREIVKSKWRRTDSPPQNLLRCLIASGSDEASPPLLQVEVSTWLVAIAAASQAGGRPCPTEDQLDLCSRVLAELPPLTLDALRRLFSLLLGGEWAAAGASQAQTALLASALATPLLGSEHPPLGAWAAAHLLVTQHLPGGLDGANATEWVRIPASSVGRSTLVTLAAALGVPEKHIGPARHCLVVARAADGASVEVGDVLIGMDGQLLDPTKEVRLRKAAAATAGGPSVTLLRRSTRGGAAAASAAARRAAAAGPPAPATPPPAPRAARFDDAADLELPRRLAALELLVSPPVVNTGHSTVDGDDDDDDDGVMRTSTSESALPSRFEVPAGAEGRAASAERRRQLQRERSRDLAAKAKRRASQILEAAESERGDLLAAAEVEAEAMWSAT